MALGLSYRCACGELFKIYLPKSKVYGEAVSQAVDWSAVDQREEADGEVDEVRRLAQGTGCTFVDGRRTTSINCAACSTPIDFLDHFRSRLLNV